MKFNNASDKIFSVFNVLSSFSLSFVDFIFVYTRNGMNNYNLLLDIIPLFYFLKLCMIWPWVPTFQLCGSEIWWQSTVVYLDIRPNQQEGNVARYWKSDRLLNTCVVIDLVEKCASTTLLDQNNSTMYSKSYPYTDR